MDKEIMTVKKLIDELLNYDKDAPISYAKGLNHIDLLIGEDPDDPKWVSPIGHMVVGEPYIGHMVAGSITIKHLGWD